MVFDIELKEINFPLVPIRGGSRVGASQRVRIACSIPRRKRRDVFLMLEIVNNSSQCWHWRNNYGMYNVRVAW